MFDEHIGIRHFSADGEGSDTAGFTFLERYNDGLPPYFNDIAFKITIGPFDNSAEGTTICLDSAMFGYGGYWLWAYNDGIDIYKPPWNGPYFFTISNKITYSGQLFYTDPVPPTISQEPIRNVTIEMWDNDLITDQLLDVTVTENDGSFAFGPVDNTDDGGLSGQDVYFRIYAANDATTVREEYDGDIHKIETPEQPDLPSGVYDTTIIADATASGPFFIADAALVAQDYWINVTGMYAPLIQIISNNEAYGTYYDPDSIYIHILNISDNPDTYDKDVIMHEYGHFLEGNYQFFDDWDPGPHGWFSISTPEIAATEGFATFFSDAVRNDSFYHDLYNNFADTDSYNAENGQDLFNSQINGSANDYGIKYEGAVCCLLWDIYDYPDDDYSTYQVPPAPWPNAYNPDGTGDALYMGAYDIFDVLLNRFIDGHRPHDIIEFWRAWFQSPSKGHGQEMLDIYYEHGICRLGDANEDGVVNVGDVTYLMNFVFKDGPSPVPMEIGDTNSDGSINIGDPVYLINFIFKSGTPLCPN
ncbi:MAG: hypothetical protein GY841_19045 [FCB group bacterium]|nr:hypothetical protein [FCB group bacterium]